MGLYGALIVRPELGPSYAYNDPQTEFARSTCPAQRDRPRSAPRGRARPAVQHLDRHPEYWHVNGRSFPDTIADNGVAYLPDQPYGALVDVGAVRRGGQPAARSHPLRERRHGQPSAPPARQPPARDRPRRAAPARPGRGGHLLRGLHAHDRIRAGVRPSVPVGRRRRLGDRRRPGAGDDPRSPEPRLQGRRDLLQRQILASVSRESSPLASRPSTSAASSTSRGTATR